MECLGLMYRPMRISLIIAGLFGLSALAFAVEYLDAQAVRQLITGKTVEATNPGRATTSVTYFDPNGTFRQLLDGKPETGTWSVDDAGYLTTNREGWGASRRKIAREGNVWKLYKVPNSNTKPIEYKKSFTRIIDGNPNHL